MKTQITIYVADTRGYKPMHAVTTIEVENWMPLDASDDLTNFVPRQIARIECHNERGSFVWPARGT